jgi:transcriptional regulator with XRE-family HTH domain
MPIDPPEGVHRLSVLLSLFEDSACLSSFEGMLTMSSNEDGEHAMPEEFALTGWSKLGALVRETRLSHGFSQAALADRAGVARSWLARVEAGHRGVELEPLLRLLAALDLTLTLRSNRDAAQGQPSRDQAPAVPVQMSGTRQDSTHDVGADLRTASQERRASWGLPNTSTGSTDDD